MINTGMNFMYFYWHLAVFPTLALAITVLATSLFGDGLRDALDPTMKAVSASVLMRELFLLDPEVCFLNHGSFGACPRSVFERYQAWQAQLERQPVAFLDPERGYGQWMGETRQALAAVLGAEADDIVGCMNATAGLNLVARSLPLAPGDEILTSDHEYAALEKTWSFVAKRTGARIVPVEIPLPLESATQFEDAVISAMSDRTRVLFLSQITSPTALCFPLTGVIAEARRRGAFTVKTVRIRPGMSRLTWMRWAQTSLLATAISGCWRQRGRPFCMRAKSGRACSIRSSFRMDGSLTERLPVPSAALPLWMP